MLKSIICLFRTASLILALFAISLIASAQVSTASITGVVQDVSGAVVPGAIVVATQTKTNASSTVHSDGAGNFSLPALPVGPYTLNVSAPGFGTKQESGLDLTVGQVANLRIQLSVGDQQTVTVSTAAPLIDATSATIENTIEQSSVVNLPLDGRNPARLVFDVAGAVDSQRGQVQTGQLAAQSEITPSGITIPGSIAPAVNGVRAGGTYFSLDGASNVDPLAVIGLPFPDPDATQEFEAVTGTYGARYVSAPGGAINIVTNAGGNKFHGTVFEFIRNGAVNGENAILATPDILKRNQFGGTIGGPVVKDKLFFFFSYQGTRISDQIPQSFSVPTPAERSGNYTLCPNGQTCTAANSKTINVSSLPPIFGPNTESPIASNFFNYMGSGNSLLPLANSGATTYNVGVPARSVDEQYVGRVDYQLTPHQRVFARYLSDHYTLANVPFATSAPYNILRTAAGNTEFFDTSVLGHTYTPNQHFVFETRVSYLNIVSNQAAPASNSFVNYAALGAQNYAEPNPAGEATTVISGLIPPAPYGTAKYPRSSFGLTEDVDYLRGRHDVTFGGDFNYVHSGISNPEGQPGVAVFVGVYTPILTGIFYPGYTLQDAPFADFYLGHPIAFIQGDGFYQSIHAKLFGLYGQDKWRLTDRLTATYGLRWDPYLSYKPERNAVDCFRPGSQSHVFANAPTGLIFPGDTGCPDGGTNSKMNIFEPRVGLAYQLNKAGTETLRAGYGIYSIQVPLNAFTGFESWPFVRQTQFTNPFQSTTDVYGSNGQSNPYLSGFNGFGYQPPANLAFPTAVQNESNFAPNFRPAYVQQYSLSIQNQFTPNDSIELAYVGTKGVFLPQSYDANEPIGATTTGGEQAARPYGANFAVISTETPVGFSKYNSGQVTYRHRTAYGLTVLSNFTWSKCFDNGSNPGNTGDTVGGDLSYDPAHKNFNNGRCDFDQPYNFRTTIVYNTPALKQFNKAAQFVLGKWTATTNAIVDSGQPFSIEPGGQDNSFTGTDLDRADYVTGQPTYKNGRLNPLAFAENSAGTLGNTPRNGFRAPYYFNVDTGLMKTFPVTERVGVLFRAEAFNVINHPNYYAISNSLNVPNFGMAQYAQQARTLQFALKILF